jgi:nucleoside-diphosphate-sugar epimerase
LAVEVITVLGASGYIGSHLVEHLAAHGIDQRVARGRDDWQSGNLGDVVWCIGLTGDFRQRPHEAIDAHVGVLSEFVRTAHFESLTYLSSTRVYKRGKSRACEEDELTFDPAVFDDVYGLSKALGESVVLNLTDRGRVVRLANVYGGRKDASGFLSAVLRQATGGNVELETALDSRRDYVCVSDVVEVLVRISGHGEQRIYNVASGRGITNGELIDAVARLTGCAWGVAEGAETVTFPEIDISRARGEFGFAPRHVLDELPALVSR